MGRGGENQQGAQAPCEWMGAHGLRLPAVSLVASDHTEELARTRMLIVVHHQTWLSIGGWGKSAMRTPGAVEELVIEFRIVFATKHTMKEPLVFRKCRTFSGTAADRAMVTPGRVRENLLV
jgi:hypothetical protein